MAFSKETFIDGFISESREHIDSINTAIVSLKNNSKDIPLLKEVLRHLHTIKGSSRMLDFLQIEQLAHSLEDIYKSILEERIELTTNITSLTYLTTEAIEMALVQISESGSSRIETEIYADLCKKAAAGYFFDPEIITKHLSENDRDEDELEFGINDSFDNINSVRIDISRINDIIQSFDNLIIRQFRLKYQIEELEKKLMESSQKEFWKIPKQLEEDLMGAESAIFQTQHQIFGLRMLPLEMVLTPLRKEIDKNAITLKKNVTVDIPQTNFMLDKIILEQLRTILLHLLRNSLAHGIETKEERIALGKNPVGTISIHAVQVSNRILISVKDDGRGLQYETIRTKAKKQNPGLVKEIDMMNDKDLQQFIFTAGFTTQEIVTEMSGRGMGLDIVRTCMEKIKAKIKIESKLNEGTTMELSIPLTLATQKGLFVQAGIHKVMIPSHYIQEIITSTNDNILLMQSQSYIQVHGKLIPLYYLASILEAEKPKEITAVIIVEYLETRMAIVVDSIHQNENVIVNPMPKLLQKISSLQGVVYDENYAIIPILDIPTLMQKLRDLVAYDIKKYQTKNLKHVYKVLIVDDSATTRQIEQTIFETDGYVVETASDGVEAMEKLKQTHIDVIITDVSMPRMDGATLLSNIRRMAEYEKTPVVIVSGVYDNETKTKLISEGAQAFIVKSEFKRGNLLQAVKELLGE